MNCIIKSVDKLLFEFSVNFKQYRLFSTFRSPENWFTSRTHTCGELNSRNVGESVVLCGWLQYQRLNKFAVLRDAYGSVQIVIPEKREDLMKTLCESCLESVICIQGQVIDRPKSQINEKMSTGSIEVEASSFKVLNSVNRDLPFSIRNYNKAKEHIRMNYRYLDLRFPEMQRNLRLRSKIIFALRKHLIDKGFVEVETPTLFKRTPGGAQEYVVPTEVSGEFYALVQSPQQLKQLLMVGGVDRYFQVARCYRNEGARPDRQPEFSQLDIEMSFANEEGVMSLTENLVRETWPADELGPLSSLPFPRISYSDAIQFYGCDKPDLLSDIKIQRLEQDLLSSCSDIVQSSNPRLIVFPKASEFLTSSVRKIIDDIRRKQFPQTRLHIWKFPFNSHEFNSLLSSSKTDMDTQKLKFSSSMEALHNLIPGDLMFMAFGNKEIEVLELLGKIRVEMLKHIPMKAGGLKWNMVWVVDFPLFDCDDTGCLKPMHHPFTQPNPEDLHLLSTDPLKVRGLHYDLVLNGWEIAGGSVRIHSSKLQKDILDMLGIDSCSLNHMLQALDSGAPPHAGIALGLDRYISLMVNAPSIRDVIAFPKTSEGRDLMSSSPSSITQEELDLYKISVKRPASEDQTSEEHSMVQ